MHEKYLWYMAEIEPGIIGYFRPDTHLRSADVPDRERLIKLFKDCGCWGYTHCPAADYCDETYSVDGSFEAICALKEAIMSQKLIREDLLQSDDMSAKDWFELGTWWGKAETYNQLDLPDIQTELFVKAEEIPALAAHEAKLYEQRQKQMRKTGNKEGATK